MGTVVSNVTPIKSCTEFNPYEVQAFLRQSLRDNDFTYNNWSQCVDSVEEVAKALESRLKPFNPVYKVTFLTVPTNTCGSRTLLVGHAFLDIMICGGTYRVDLIGDEGPGPIAGLRQYLFEELRCTSTPKVYEEEVFMAYVTANANFEDTEEYKAAKKFVFENQPLVRSMPPEEVVECPNPLREAIDDLWELLPSF
ncbi:hypothetical protein K1X76_06420 [bacterium]|nr:hypothetical protein [bacterium]